MTDLSSQPDATAQSNENSSHCGPFPIVKSNGTGDVPNPVEAPERRYSCPNYEKCLNLAAAINWDNFTCQSCCGEIDQKLQWRAHQARRSDAVAQTLCELPQIEKIENDSEKIATIGVSSHSVELQLVGK